MTAAAPVVASPSNPQAKRDPMVTIRYPAGSDDGAEFPFVYPLTIDAEFTPNGAMSDELSELCAFVHVTAHTAAATDLSDTAAANDVAVDLLIALADNGHTELSGEISEWVAQARVFADESPLCPVAEVLGHLGSYIARTHLADVIAGVS